MKPSSARSYRFCSSLTPKKFQARRRQTSKQNPAMVRENLPVIYHSRKSHSVLLKDLQIIKPSAPFTRPTPLNMSEFQSIR